MEDKVWPSDWPCKCGHSLESHKSSSLHDFICVVEGNFWEGWADRCMKYEPVDNLTYMEIIANKKEIIGQ